MEYLTWGGQTIDIAKEPFAALKLAMQAGDNCSSHRTKSDWDAICREIVTAHFPEKAEQFFSLLNTPQNQWRCSFDFNIDFLKPQDPFTELTEAMQAGDNSTTAEENKKWGYACIEIVKKHFAKHANRFVNTMNHTQSNKTFRFDFEIEFLKYDFKEHAEAMEGVTVAMVGTKKISIAKYNNVVYLGFEPKNIEDGRVLLRLLFQR